MDKQIFPAAYDGPRLSREENVHTIPPREHPMLFSGPMVRALQLGTKTESRRVIKPQPELVDRTTWRGTGRTGYKGWDWRSLQWDESAVDLLLTYLAGRGRWQPGDRIWGRETWQANTHPDTAEYFRNGRPSWLLPPKLFRPLVDTPNGYLYRADDIAGHIDGGWRPSIFMPRTAARIFLEVTSIRAERLLDITLEGARAEGIPQTGAEARDLGFPAKLTWPGHVWDNNSSVENYLAGWNKLNPKWPANGNPFVWVVGLKVAQCR